MDAKLFAINLGKRIQLLRTQCGFTQEELAKKVGYEGGKSNISKIESGKTEVPFSKLNRFADVLHTNIAYLMGWDEEFRSISQDELELILLYRHASDRGKTLAIGNLQATQEDTDSAVG